MSKDKLRIGLILDELDLAAWAYRMVEIITQSDYAEIVLVIQTAMPDAKKRQTKAEVMARGTQGMCQLLERFLVGKPGYLPNAAEKIDGRVLLTNIEMVNVHPRVEQGFDFIECDEIARICTYKVDVLINLSSLNPRGDIISSARFGIWICDHGDGIFDDRGSIGYRQVMESSSVTFSVLKMLREGIDGGYILYRSASSTDVMSLADNQSGILWKSLHFIPRKLRELYQDGEEVFLAKVKQENVAPQFHDKKLHEHLTNGKRNILVLKKMLQKVRRKWESIFYFRQWLLFYDIRKDISMPLGQYESIMPPKAHFWADPFVISRDDTYYIFIEEGSCIDGKGHISLIVMNKEGSWSPPVCVLKAPHHLSYPFVFEFEDSYYMIPESYDNRTIDLYKCTKFPFGWEFHKTLVGSARAVDTTLVQWQNRWWMFSNRSETEGASPSDELFLYYSDSPLSDDWTPHPRNPVVSDVRSARPAGRLFVRDGHLYRPSQNCSRHYGYGFNICEITKLTETEYEERIVSKVEPNWNREIVSTHTVNYADGLTIVDAEVRRRK